jgi:hypothetical protein
MSDVHLAKPSAVTHRTLRSGHEQHVVDTGPYRLVRHPGYTGSLLTWTGLALASRSTSFSPWSPRCWEGFHHRITAEQQQLQRDLPGYLAYSQHTKKLIPFVWLQALQRSNRATRRRRLVPEGGSLLSSVDAPPLRWPRQLSPVEVRQPPVKVRWGLAVQRLWVSARHAASPRIGRSSCLCP